MASKVESTLGSAGGHGHHGVHVSSVGFNAIVLAALLGLTGLTYVTATMDLGFLDSPIALLIAFTKTTLVILFFMHVRWGSGYVWILASTGFIFLLFLFGFTFADVLTRTQEQPWSEITWPGARSRVEQGKVPAPGGDRPAVEGRETPVIERRSPGPAPH